MKKIIVSKQHKPQYRLGNYTFPDGWSDTDNKAAQPGLEVQAARLSLATSAFLHAIFSFLGSDFVVILPVGNSHLTTKVMKCGLVVVNSE